MMPIFTPGEWVLLIGLLAHAAAISFALWITRRRIGHDVQMIARELHSGVEKIEEVRHETNNMRSQLEAGARAEGRAAGVLEEKERQQMEARPRR